MAECTCFLLPPEMWTTHYGAVEPGSTHEPNPNCREHFRKPPARLADGTWSDGVDRSQPMREREAKVGRWEVWRNAFDGWVVDFDSGKIQGSAQEEFPTHAEAIAYADRMARTNQGENND